MSESMNIGQPYWLPAIHNNHSLFRLPAAFERPTRKIRDDTGGKIAPCIILNLNNRTSLFCQIDSVVADAALRGAAGDEEDAVAFGGGVGTADDVVKVFLRADGAVVDLEDDEVLGYTGTFQFTCLERFDLQAVVDTQALFLRIGQFGERGT